MTYIKVTWHHDISSEPVIIYSELDGDRWDKRKVEEYLDGRLDAASHDFSTGTTGLSLEPIPPDAEIRSNPEFTLHEISQNEFESIWRKAASHP